MPRVLTLMGIVAGADAFGGVYVSVAGRHGPLSPLSPRRRFALKVSVIGSGVGSLKNCATAAVSKIFFGVLTPPSAFFFFGSFLSWAPMDGAHRPIATMTSHAHVHDVRRRLLMNFSSRELGGGGLAQFGVDQRGAGSGAQQRV